MTDTCPICLEEMTGVTTTTNCNHIFCKDCLDAWTESNNDRHNNCPCCRAVLNEDLVEEDDNIFDDFNFSEDVMSGLIEEHFRGISIGMGLRRGMRDMIENVFAPQNQHDFAIRPIPRIRHLENDPVMVDNFIPRNLMSIDNEDLRLMTQRVTERFNALPENERTHRQLTGLLQSREMLIRDFMRGDMRTVTFFGRIEEINNRMNMIMYNIELQNAELP